MTLPDRLIAIVIVNFVIAMLMRLGPRLLPELERRDLHGVYLMLLPLGFGLFGWDIPYWMSTSAVVVGLAMLAFAMRRVFHTLTEGET